MPQLVDAQGNFTTPNAYQFTGMDPHEDLGASEFTLVTVCQDISLSVANFRSEMTVCLKQILESYQKAPRKENLMHRLVGFNHDIHELHGFRHLMGIDPSEYDNILRCSGSTALFDAVHTSVDAMMHYARQLAAKDIMANGIGFIVTDGWDNRSKSDPSEVQRIVQEALNHEDLESIITVLIGITHGQSEISSELERFKDESGITQYIDIGDASPENLARLADFVSRSVSSQSQYLKTGGPSVSLEF